MESTLGEAEPTPLLPFSRDQSIALPQWAIYNEDTVSASTLLEGANIFHLEEEHMQVRYSTVIASNPSYSAQTYARRWWLAAITPAIYSVVILLFFFLLPWFSVSAPSSLSNLGIQRQSLDAVSAMTIASGGATMKGIVVDPIQGKAQFVTDTFSFYPLWIFPLAGLAEIICSAIFFTRKLLTPWLSRAILIGYGVAFLTAFIFIGVAFFAAMGNVKGAGAAISTYPGLGAWLTLLATIIAAIISGMRMPSLLWSLSLAEDDLVRSGRMTALQNSRKPA